MVSYGKSLAYFGLSLNPKIISKEYKNKYDKQRITTLILYFFLTEYSNMIVKEIIDHAKRKNNEQNDSKKENKLSNK